MIRWIPLLFLVSGCSGSTGASGVEEARGPIEDRLDDLDETVWPGVVTEDGTRLVRLLNGFFQGEPSAYWFAGFASRNTPDVFWFCREGDAACPFDARGVTDPSRAVGHPVFASLPGDADYSPFWLAWVVFVDDDYEPDALKSVQGIADAEARGEVRVEQVFHDFGGATGPQEAIHHCLLVLTGTELEGNGDDLVGQPGVPSHSLAPQTGWFEGYAVEFFDFTDNEGLFPPDPASETRPKMPAADIFVFFRDCEGGSASRVCELAATSAEAGAVSERGVEEDLTGDGDKADNNNIISGFPGVENTDEQDAPYSPLWKVLKVLIPPEHDDEVRLFDTTGDQDDSDIKDLGTLREYLGEGLLEEPIALSETQAGNAIPGNDGEVFFNCPSQRGER